MAGNIWVMAEQWNGGISEVTYELLALGRELADGLGVSLEVVLLGHEAEELAAGLGEADVVLYGDDPALQEPTAEAYSRVLTAVIRERGPHGILIPVTNVTWDLLGLLPAELGAPLLNFCKDVGVADGRLEARCLLYGGKMEANVAATGTPAILGVMAGARAADGPAAGEAPPIERFPVSLPEAPRTELQRYVEAEAGDVDLTQQEVLVAVGRGIGFQDNVELAEELAEELGGAVCGSRPVIDQGWLSLSRQIGKSGVIVKPRLYVAAGISGAPEHVEGMKDSEMIIAINTDPEAPIFSVAHYGIVEDANDVMEALTEAIQEAKG
jgi:electron transfer flavoprotein alpha subunit